MIGYCPMIHGSASEFSTIFTLMKVSQEVARRLQQDDSVITFDLAIYMKARQIQLKFPDAFKNTVIRMGGFHIALNYLSLLGKKYANSGLEDLLIESGVYAAGTTSVLMLGEVVQPWHSSTQAQYGSILSSSLASISAVAGKPNSGSDYPRQAEFESRDPGM